MKQLTLFLTVLMVLFVVSCAAKELSIPEGLSITDGIITFESVDQAKGYRIQATLIETEQARLYVVDNGLDLNTLFMTPGYYEIKIQATGDGKKITDSPYSEPVTYTQTDPYAISMIEDAFLTDDIHIRWFGRTYYDDSIDANYFYFTASGFEATFYGTSLEATFVATNTTIEGKRPHLVVYVDGETDPRGTSLLVLDQTIGTYVLAEGLDPGIHTVKVLKRSESIDSMTALSRLSTDGHFEVAALLKDHKIEVIAASSSAGFGNLAANTGVPKTTANSDGLRSYATLAAHMLDAEINIFSASGWPLVKGPWTGDNNIPLAYDFVNVYSDKPWNHDRFVPDVIVINLGTNDWSYINALSAIDKEAALETFIQSYVNFIETLNDLHPEARIVIVYGLMNETHIFDETLEVFTRATAQMPDLSINYIQLPGANQTDGIGSSSHPGLLTHIKAADQLANAISEWMTWPIVRPNTGTWA
ncbi:MAG: hypothetical protein K9K93_02435 [Acholeplasmataceae bacterium]|nr:hypothetical protein [Acholeplasmataceae bacterium]